MLRKYSVAAVELLTGEAPTREVECDGYVIMGFVRGEDGRMEAVRVGMNHVNDELIVNGLYSNPDLRKCAIIVAEVHKMYNRPWRRLWRWLRGERDEKEA